MGGSPKGLCPSSVAVPPPLLVAQAPPELLLVLSRSKPAFDALVAHPHTLQQLLGAFFADLFMEPPTAYGQALEFWELAHRHQPGLLLSHWCGATAVAGSGACGALRRCCRSGACGVVTLSPWVAWASCGARCVLCCAVLTCMALRFSAAPHISPIFAVRFAALPPPHSAACCLPCHACRDQLQGVMAVVVGPQAAKDSPTFVETLLGGCCCSCCITGGCCCFGVRIEKEELFNR